MDILDRKSSPLTEEEWQRIDQAVLVTARNMLVGRKMIEVLGPLGPGVYALPYSIFSGLQPAGMDMIGDRGDLVAAAERRETINIPMLFKDFKIFWRDVEADRHLGIPLDVSVAAVATADVVVQEDDLVFNGNKELGQKGLLTAEGRLQVKKSDWQEGGILWPIPSRQSTPLLLRGITAPIPWRSVPFFMGRWCGFTVAPACSNWIRFLPCCGGKSIRAAPSRVKRRSSSPRAFRTSILPSARISLPVTLQRKT